MLTTIDIFKGALAIIVASFLWGTTGTAASFSPDISSLAIGAFAMGGGGLLLVLTSLKQLQRDYTNLIAHPIALLTGGLSVALYPLAFYSSMRLSGVAIGTVVSIASAPFFAALLERLISKKLITKKWMLSFIIGSIGIALLASGREHTATVNSTLIQSMGIVLGLVAGLTYATYSWAAKHLIDKGVHSKSAMASQFGLAAILLLPSLLFTGANLFASSTNISVSVYMAVLPMFCGYLLFGYGLKTINASSATLITLIEPLVATLLAVLIVGEQFKIIGWLGMGLVGLCLLLQTIKTNQVPIASE